MIAGSKLEAGKEESEETDQIPLPHIFWSWRKSRQKEAMKSMEKEVNMTGYKKIDKIELSREMTIILLGMGTLSIFIFGYFFTLIYTLITQNTAAFNFTYSTILIAIPIFAFLYTVIP